MKVDNVEKIRASRRKSPPQFMCGDLAGTVKILGDIESPVTDDWEAS